MRGCATTIGFNSPALRILPFSPLYSEMARKLPVANGPSKAHYGYPKRGHDMRREPIKVLKPAAQLEAERLGAFDELCEITSAIDLAALAVIGMAKELGGEEGHMLANHLRDQAERIRKASERLLAAPDETFSPTTDRDPQRRAFATVPRVPET